MSESVFSSRGLMMLMIARPAPPLNPREEEDDNSLLDLISSHVSSSAQLNSYSSPPPLSHPVSVSVRSKGSIHFILTQSLPFRQQAWMFHWKCWLGELGHCSDLWCRHRASPAFLISDIFRPPHWDWCLKFPWQQSRLLQLAGNPTDRRCLEICIN